MPAWSAIVRTGEGCAHKLAASSACLIACARERSRLSVGDLHTTPQLRIGAIVHTLRCPTPNIATTCNGCLCDRRTDHAVNRSFSKQIAQSLGAENLQPVALMHARAGSVLAPSAWRNFCTRGRGRLVVRHLDTTRRLRTRATVQAHSLSDAEYDNPLRRKVLPIRGARSSR